MTEPSPGSRAVESLEISDVFVVESRCNIVRDYNPMQVVSRFQYQQRIAPEPEGMTQLRKEEPAGEEIHVLRYFISCGFRVLKPEVSVDNSVEREISEQEILAEITATLAVDYVAPSKLLADAEAIGAFSKNAVFHAWPYWRALIHSFTDQMRMPRVTLPMLRQITPKNFANADFDIEPRTTTK